jgi:hypothetical protein
VFEVQQNSDVTFRLYDWGYVDAKTGQPRPLQVDQAGSPDRFDVYYGMADNRIGVARLDLPDFLPPQGGADPPEGKV